MSKGENPLVHRIPVKDKNGRVIGEKEVVAYRGLLDMVHKERLQKIVTRLVQAPSKENGETAIVLATIQTARGTFTGLGDANPRNVNAKIAPHLIRMAESSSASLGFPRPAPPLSRPSSTASRTRTATARTARPSRAGPGEHHGQHQALRHPDHLVPHVPAEVRFSLCRGPPARTSTVGSRSRERHS